MIATNRLTTALLPLAPLRLLGLSPQIGGRLSIRSTSCALLFALSMLVPSVWFYQSAFYLQVISQTVALLFCMGRNLLDRTDFLAVMDMVQVLDQSHSHRYTFRWSVLLSALQIVHTAALVSIQGFVPADVVLFVYILKQEGVLVLIHVLRCQSAVLEKTPYLQDYHRVSRALSSLRSYLAPEVGCFCFLCFLSASKFSLLGVNAMVKAFVSPSSAPPPLPTICYWAGFLTTLSSLLALVEAYRAIEERKEEFEDRLYWALVSATPVHLSRISDKYKMLFEISSREKEEEKLRIDYKLIYSVVSASVTFMVLLLQFGLEYIICDVP